MRGGGCNENEMQNGTLSEWEKLNLKRNAERQAKDQEWKAYHKERYLFVVAILVVGGGASAAKCDEKKIPWAQVLFTPRQKDELSWLRKINPCRFFMALLVLCGELR